MSKQITVTHPHAGTIKFISGRKHAGDFGTEYHGWKNGKRFGEALVIPGHASKETIIGAIDNGLLDDQETYRSRSSSCPDGLVAF